MAFPEYNFFGLEKGWRDRGPVQPTEGTVYECCSRCYSIVRIGIDEDQSRFKFCPKCLVKANNKSEI